MAPIAYDKNSRAISRPRSEIKAKEEEKRKSPAKKKTGFVITPTITEEFLGQPRYKFGKAEEVNEVGMTNGLAWTEVGGDLLIIEVSVVPGRGKFTVTGQLGDVMKESCSAAMSYVRSRALQFDLDKDFYQKVDIHIHVPEGAIPKDGPSAGITMATSIVSALLRIPVKKEVAMTGEITLRGKVLPIGGLKEKLLAAHRGQIKTVVIPKENEKDLKEVPPKIKNALKIFCAEHLDDVLKHALNLPNPERIFRKKDINLVMEEIYLKKEIPPVKAKEEEIIAHH